MSMNANVLPRSGLMGSAATATAPRQTGVLAEVQGWDPDNFAREQIRGLVRRVFLANSGKPVKQVAFSAAEPGTDVGVICDQVGHALALETPGEVAIVSRNSPAPEMTQAQNYPRYSGSSAIKACSTQIAANLWRVPAAGLRELSPEPATGRYWLWALAELRNDFEYAVIHGPEAGTSSESAVLGQLAEGIILVIEAHNTRKATARKIKEMLEASQSRILGTVLSERTFPVPEKLYRRL
ncbi:MAG: P-loop NTPase family protein [Candidatus Sulfotelmatobacter sp.]